MKRSPIVIGATVLGTAGVLALHATPQTTQASTATTRSTTSTASAPTSTTTPSPSTGATTVATSTASTTTRAAAVAGSATGESIATKYGNVQVKVTIAGGKITTVQAVQLTDSDPKSVQISASAEPSLKQEALSAQSANIDVVSGATYTSAAYAQSLQSALNKLGFKPANGSTTLQVPA